MPSSTKNYIHGHISFPHPMFWQNKRSVAKFREAVNAAARNGQMRRVVEMLVLSYVML